MLSPVRISRDKLNWDFQEEKHSSSEVFYVAIHKLCDRFFIVFVRAVRADLKLLIDCKSQGGNL